MLKRLEVSEQSAREKSIRHGHISTLHIWWARREIGDLYPPDPDGGIPVAYLWARTVKSPSRVPDGIAAVMFAHKTTTRRFGSFPQAISEILPDGDKEEQLMQGLLNRREVLEEAARQKELF